MQYLDSFIIPSDEEEAEYILNENKLEWACYQDNVYPFKVFIKRKIKRFDFGSLTVFYGGNGSGKSTLLNIIAQKLGLERGAPFNKTPFFENYLGLCSYRLTYGKKAPEGSRIITSDDVFDYLLNIRSVNDGISRRRTELFDEYSRYTNPKNPDFRHFQLGSLDDYEELKKRNEARHKTKSDYTSGRIPEEVRTRSNGESAFEYFSGEIKENALYLLDEPENSLSPRLQKELCRFLSDSVRFYGCQLIISTHSPFLLSSKGAVIYDLDSCPICEKKWTELENVRVYRDFFEEHRDEFKN